MEKQETHKGSRMIELILDDDEGKELLRQVYVFVPGEYNKFGGLGGSYVEPYGYYERGKSELCYQNPFKESKLENLVQTNDIFSLSTEEISRRIARHSYMQNLEYLAGEEKKDDGYFKPEEIEACYRGLKAFSRIAGISAIEFSPERFKKLMQRAHVYKYRDLMEYALKDATFGSRTFDEHEIPILLEQAQSYTSKIDGFDMKQYEKSREEINTILKRPRKWRRFKYKFGKISKFFLGANHG